MGAPPRRDNPRDEPEQGRGRPRPGELAGVAKQALLALSVGVGLGVMAELMAEELDEVVGPKGKHDPERSAVRHGHEAGEVTLGGRRVAGRASKGAHRRRRVGGGACDLPALRRPRSAHSAGARADARRRLHAPLRAHPRAGRRGGRGRGALDLEGRRSVASSSRARARTSTRSYRAGSTMSASRSRAGKSLLSGYALAWTRTD